MAITRLSIYNKALSLIGERALADVSERREPRFVLDNLYNYEAINTCLELAKPKFAQRTAQLINPVASTTHGLPHTYTFPTDYISTLELSGPHGGPGSFYADESLNNPIDRYIVERRGVSCDIPTRIWMRYISADVTFADWTPSFANVVAAWLAREAAKRLNPNASERTNTYFDEALAALRQLEPIKEDVVLPQQAPTPLSDEKLAIYNDIARRLGLLEFRDGADQSTIRLAIDSVYDTSEAFLLATVQPRFAARYNLITQEQSPPPTTSRQLDNFYSFPADYVYWLGVYSDANLDVPITRYTIHDTGFSIEDEVDPTLWFISDSATESQWSSYFTEAFTAHVAHRVCRQFAPDKEPGLKADKDAALTAAITLDRVTEPTVRPLPAAVDLNATLIQVYNDALHLLGEPEIISNADQSYNRAALDRAFGGAAGTGAQKVLQEVQPVFAIVVGRSTGTAPLPADTAGQGYGFLHDLSALAGFISNHAVYSDDRLEQPVSRFWIQGTSLYTDYENIFVRYVGSATASPDGIASWQPKTREALAGYLANEVASGVYSRKAMAQEGFAEVVPAMLSRIGKMFRERLEAAIQLERWQEPPVRPVKSTRTLTADTLRLYNKALQIMGLPPLTTIDDDSMRRAALDYAMDQQAVQTVFELTSWGFGYKTQRLTTSDDNRTEFGLQYAFSLPADMMRIDAVSGNEYFTYPEEYTLEQTSNGLALFADIQELYLRYVSNDLLTQYDQWPIYLFNLVAAELARNCQHLDGVDERNVAMKYKEYKEEAYNTDAQRNPPQKIVQGPWTRYRQYNRYDTTRRFGRF